jgi:hypothetical protein
MSKGFTKNEINRLVTVKPIVLRGKHKVVARKQPVWQRDWFNKLRGWIIKNVARIVLVALASWTLYEKAENDYLIAGMFVIGMTALVHWSFNEKVDTQTNT